MRYAQLRRQEEEECVEELEQTNSKQLPDIKPAEVEVFNNSEKQSEEEIRDIVKLLKNGNCYCNRLQRSNDQFAKQSTQHEWKYVRQENSGSINKRCL